MRACAHPAYVYTLIEVNTYEYIYIYIIKASFYLFVGTTKRAGTSRISISVLKHS